MKSEISLPDYISSRWTALLEAEREVRARFEKEISSIQEERDQLKKAASVVGISVDTPPPETAQHRPPNEVAKTLPRTLKKHKTIKEAVMSVLLQEGHGLTALEILPRVNELLGEDFPRTSLSPQLSRLAKSNYLTRDGVVWSLTELGKQKYRPTDDEK